MTFITLAPKATPSVAGVPSAYVVDEMGGHLALPAITRPQIEQILRVDGGAGKYPFIVAQEPVAVTCTVTRHAVDYKALLAFWLNAVVPGKDLKAAAEAKKLLKMALSRTPKVRHATKGPQDPKETMRVAYYAACATTLRRVSTMDADVDVAACVRHILSEPCAPPPTIRQSILLSTRAFTMLAVQGHLKALQFLVQHHLQELDVDELSTSLAEACNGGHLPVIQFLCSLWPSSARGAAGRQTVPTLRNNRHLAMALKSALQCTDETRAIKIYTTLRGSLGKLTLRSAAWATTFTHSQALLKAIARQHRPRAALLDLLHKDGLIETAFVSMDAFEAALKTMVNYHSEQECIKMVSRGGVFHGCRGAAIVQALQWQPVKMGLVQAIIASREDEPLPALPRNPWELVEPITNLLFASNAGDGSLWTCLLRTVIPFVLKQFQRKALEEAVTALGLESHSLYLFADARGKALLASLPAEHPLHHAGAGAGAGAGAAAATSASGDKRAAAPLAGDRPKKRQRRKE